ALRVRAAARCGDRPARLPAALRVDGDPRQGLHPGAAAPAARPAVGPAVHTPAPSPGRRYASRRRTRTYDQAADTCDRAGCTRGRPGPATTGRGAHADDLALARTARGAQMGR